MDFESLPGAREITNGPLRSWLERGPYALALSAGYFGFFAHAGFLAVLLESGVPPARVSGSSGGALIAGLWAAGMDSAELEARLAALRRRDFWDPFPGPGLLRGRRLSERLERLLPVATFEETRVPLRVSVHDVLCRRTRVLDSGPLAPALRASCAVPLLFHPVWIGRRPFVDGGISDAAGTAGATPGERLLVHRLDGGGPAVGDDHPGERIAVRIGGLPRVGAFRLERGPEAIERGRVGAREALNRDATALIRV